MKQDTTKTSILKSQQGFTLIELIMVIVIIGIMAVVAIPKYADMKDEAAVAAADGVYGAAQGAAAINFSAALVGATQPAGGVIDSAADLLLAMEGTPDGWAANGTNVRILEATVNGTTYQITITDETATAKAGIAKGW